VTPEDETKLPISSADRNQLQPDADNNDDDDDDVKRRSSAGTYSLSSDSQPDRDNTPTGTLGPQGHFTMGDLFNGCSKLAIIVRVTV